MKFLIALLFAFALLVAAEDPVKTVRAPKDVCTFQPTKLSMSCGSVSDPLLNVGGVITLDSIVFSYNRCSEPESASVSIVYNGGDSESVTVNINGDTLSIPIIPGVSLALNDIQTNPASISFDIVLDTLIGDRTVLNDVVIGDPTKSACAFLDRSAQCPSDKCSSAALFVPSAVVVLALIALFF